MAEIRTVTTLRRKRSEILGSIANYKKRLAQAEADLAHINAAITIFEASGDPKGFPAYVDVHHLFKRGEAVAICKKALEAGPLDTRQLALAVIKAKGLDPGDKVLAKSVGHKLIHALRLQERSGKLVAKGRYKAARIWSLPPDRPLI
jgi:intracellular sulfur oxidation DsrE/DsrF family protein